MAFVLNNIRFRSVSSKTLERFYNQKAFMLNELITEKNQFSRVARETLLLLFNSYSSWCTKVEQYMLNRSEINHADRLEILKLRKRVELYHDEIYTLHSDVFKPDFIKHWKQVNWLSQQAFDAKLEKIEGVSQLEAYPMAINALIGYLQTCFYELYEVDCLLGGDFVVDRCSCNKSNPHRVLLYVDEFALEYMEDSGMFICGERYKYYRSISCRDAPLLVKNYSSEEVLFDGAVCGTGTLATELRKVLDGVQVIDIINAPPTDTVVYVNKIH